MIRNEVKGGKKIVASGNIIDKEDVKETNDIPLKQNTLRTAIIVEASKVSVNNAGDYIVMNVLHDTNNKLTIEREEENEETDDINTIQQESASILTTSIVDRASNVSVNLVILICFSFNNTFALLPKTIDDSLFSFLYNITCFPYFSCDASFPIISSVNHDLVLSFSSSIIFDITSDSCNRVTSF